MAKKGRYSFVQNFTLLTPQKTPVGVPFTELQSVDSTNNYAMRLVHEGLARHGFAVFAHEQTAGKGQRGKQWLAQQGKNIMMSVVLEPTPLFTAPSFRFSMAMAVAAYGLLKKVCPEFVKGVAADVKIKWPNDLFIGDRKAGGILIENSISAGIWKFAIAGFGININQTEFGDLGTKAVSLKQATRKDYDVIALAKKLCGEIDAVLKKLETAPLAIESIYLERLYKRGEHVKLKKGARVFDAKIIGVNAAGQLVTQHAVEEAFGVGEVEWLL